MCCVVECIFNRLMAFCLFVLSLIITVAVSVANTSSMCKFPQFITTLIYAQFGWYVVKPWIDFCGFRLLTACCSVFLSSILTGYLIDLNKESCIFIDNVDAGNILTAIGFSQGTLVVISILVLFKELGTLSKDNGYKKHQDFYDSDN